MIKILEQTFLVSLALAFNTIYILFDYVSFIIFILIFVSEIGLWICFSILFVTSFTIYDVVK